MTTATMHYMPCALSSYNSNKNSNLKKSTSAHEEITQNLKTYSGFKQSENIGKSLLQNYTQLQPKLEYWTTTYYVDFDSMLKIMDNASNNSGSPVGGSFLTNSIIITRPLKELASHVKHCKMPSWQLIARSIKTLALACFRWHFCDHAFLNEAGKITHVLKGHVSKENAESLQQQYPYMLENAYELVLKRFHYCHTRNIEEALKGKDMNPDTIRLYYQRVYQADITNKITGNTIYDLFKSQLLIIKQ